MSRGATYERVYAELKRQLLAGAFAPGGSLEPAVLSEIVTASVTPVRDALHHLAGEMLVEAHRHDGFRVPIVTEAGLRALYEWNGQVIALALRLAERDAPRPLEQTVLPCNDAAAVTGQLFQALARWSTNREHAITVMGLNDRLQVVRHAEAAVLRRFDDDLRTLGEAVSVRDIAALQSFLPGYHRARTNAVRALAALLMERYQGGPLSPASDNNRIISAV